MNISFSYGYRAVILACALFFLSPRFTSAQGTDNPTGVTGIFGAASATAGLFSPYTANATRIIPDLTVAGGVGAYPLQWTRIMNSRAPGSGVFGQGGRLAPFLPMDLQRE